MFKINSEIDKAKANGMNPIVLAFIGDAVYSLYIREKVAFTSDLKAGGLNELAIASVNAKAQAELLSKLAPILTEEETYIYKRARNSKKNTKAKSASVAEYNMSTGFEALIGYLYITGNLERINELLNYEEKE